MRMTAIKQNVNHIHNFVATTSKITSAYVAIALHVVSKIVWMDVIINKVCGIVCYTFDPPAYLVIDPLVFYTVTCREFHQHIIILYLVQVQNLAKFNVLPYFIHKSLQIANACIVYFKELINGQSTLWDWKGPLPPCLKMGPANWYNNVTTICILLCLL